MTYSYQFTSHIIDSVNPEVAEAKRSCLYVTARVSMNSISTASAYPTIISVPSGKF